MGLFICATNHRVDGLDPVEALTDVVDAVAADLAHDPRVRGVLALATCNRVELVVDAHSDGTDPEHRLVAFEVSTMLAERGHLCPRKLYAHAGPAAVLHLFELACGLDSAVLGEREIAGQLRRALIAAREAGTASYLIAHTVEAALQTSRRVAQFTRLSGNGRSVVAVGLDLAAEHVDLPHASVLLVGTGSYAGTSIAALTARGVTDIACFSSTGRAAAFAETHPVRPVTDLTSALAEADLVIGCSGSQPLTAEVITASGRDELVVLDLAVGGDLSAEAAALPQVRAIGLAEVSLAAPSADRAEVVRAREFVREGVHDLAMELDRRRMAPAVVALRDLVSEQVDKELADLPADGTLTVEEVAEHLRRMAARMVHIPSLRARLAAESGRGESFVQALAEVLGVEVELAAPMLDVGDLMQFNQTRCPVTGLGIDDLAQQRSNHS